MHTLTAPGLQLGHFRGYSGRTKAIRASTAPRLVRAPRMTDGGLRLHAHRQAHAHVALRKKSLHEVRYSPQTKACGRAATQGHHGRAQVGGRAPACEMCPANTSCSFWRLKQPALSSHCRALLASWWRQWPACMLGCGHCRLSARLSPPLIDMTVHRSGHSGGGA